MKKILQAYLYRVFYRSTHFFLRKIMVFMFFPGQNAFLILL